MAGKALVGPNLAYLGALLLGNPAAGVASTDRVHRQSAGYGDVAKAESREVTATVAREEIVTRTGRTWLGEDGIMRAVHLPNSVETLADAKENMAATVKLSAGKRYPILVDLRPIKSIDRDAREYYARGDQTEVVTAVALLIGSPISRVIGNFILALNTPRIPAKIFTSEAEALDWLRGFLP